jgi:maltose alpha-D-glucosyltransferase/alpha-amylase
MPRIFMALRQEERHPIVEIMKQTPEIPDSCQWALFLRNHDELTLEMVTDEERDYMYQVYAADPQMRLNLGIRRRLAPLVENSRRRIELLSAMLFSFPGTPIMYYGDELGMGDNIYLGDRNGVRTPMQWSSDRNGGFSRADAARLYAPPIQDPVYGFQAINVEAQERYPFSLLNWMKRLVAIRKQHRVFGRGSLEFVGCSNRRILAYLRRDERETILCVVNLSRAMQPAELELQAFAGLIPVEMAGLTEFPRIGTSPYFLSLGPYASYWFALQQAPMQMAPRVTPSRDAASAIAESLPALLVGVDWQTVLDGGTRTVLERRALVPFLQRQRWFASKSREVTGARFVDWTTLRAGAHPAFLTIVAVDYADGWSESYFVPLSLVSGADSARALDEAPDRVLARITGARKGAIVDGLEDDDTCDRLLAAIAGRREIATQRGTIRGEQVEDQQVALDGDRRWVRGASDQSNSVAFVGDRYMLKLFRRVEPSLNPEYEIGRFLTARRFPRTPALVGGIEYLRPGLEPGTLAVVQAAVKHQGSGWDFMINELRRFYERVSVQNPDLDRPAYSMNAAQGLARRTAELHLALAQGTDEAFRPEPFDGADIDTVAERMDRHAAEILDLLARQADTLGGPSRELAERLLAARGAVRAIFSELRRVRDGGRRIRVHGDYHLGQLLRTEEDFVILDFEGEPARSIAERRARQSPLKDVAGMVRSFGYASYAALIAETVHAPDRLQELEPAADAWQQQVSDAFVASYVERLGAEPTGRALLPDASATATLLRAFVVEKAMYELGYELNHRPEWVRIPLMGIHKLIG